MATLCHPLDGESTKGQVFLDKTDISPVVTKNLKTRFLSRSKNLTLTSPYRLTRKHIMATAKKVPAKKTAKVVTIPANKTAVRRVLASKRTIASAKKDEMFAMPQEVKEWIDRASSTMKHQANQIAELKKEVMELKVYKKFAANKIQGMSYE